MVENVGTQASSCGPWFGILLTYNSGFWLAHQQKALVETLQSAVSSNTHFWRVTRDD